MQGRELLLLLLALALASRKRSGPSSGGWSPMGPFPEDNTIPAQPTIPPNPLEHK